MLSTPWEQRKNKYDFVIIGSGYGGAIAAARLAGGQSQSEALGLHSGARQGAPARRVSGNAGRRDRGGAQFGESAGTVRTADVSRIFR